MAFKKQNLLYGIHPVSEALKSGRTIDKAMVKQGNNSPQVNELIAALRKANVTVQFVPPEKLNRITSKNHQGLVAFLSEIDYTDLSQLVPFLYEQGKIPFLLFLDGITDVRNFGGIARTAECAGVDGIIIPSTGSVSVTADALKTSAGALNKIPVCREKNISRSLIYLKESGIQLVGTTEKASDYFYNADYTIPTALILGAEDTGLSPQVLKQADKLVKIPLLGSIQSLNVGIAASLIMYEVVRQRNKEFLTR